MPTIKTGEAFTVSHRWLQFSGSPATGLSATVTLERDGVPVAVAPALTMVQDGTDATLYRVAVPGTATGTPGRYRVTMALSEDAAAVNVVEHSHTSEPIDVQPTFVTDIDVLRTLVDVATSAAATPADVQAEIQGAVDQLVATFDNPNQPTQVQQAILDQLSAAYAAAAAAETEATAATRYANLLANVQQCATPTHISAAQQAILDQLAVASAVAATADQVDAILAKLVGVQVIVTAPLDPRTGVLKLWRGNSYGFGGAPALDFTEDLSSGNPPGWPDLTGRQARFETGGMVIPGEVTGPQACTVTISSEQTANMASGVYKVVAVLPDGKNDALLYAGRLTMQG